MATGHDAGARQSCLGGAPYGPRAMGREGQGPGPHSRFMKTRISTRSYHEYLQQNNYMKSNKVIKVKGKQTYISIITVNLTSHSEAARQWLCEQTADILLPEHHMFSMKKLGIYQGIPCSSHLPAKQCIAPGDGKHLEE